MRYTSFAITLICLCPLGMVLAETVRAETDSGRASAYPWSGYWWQHRSGGLTGPLEKYDRLVSAAAAQWERETHVLPDVPTWYGHCHAWAASSVCEGEPKRGRSVRRIAFGVGDQKGLLAACHAQDVSNSHGDRFGDGEGSEERADLAPDEVWRLLQMYVKQRKIPLILDLEAGEQVWNYPVYQYQVDFRAARNEWYQCSMQLVVADNNVSPDYVGTQPALYTYTFRVRMRDGAVVSGSGQWTGDSVEDHPDFAWYPYVAVAENPEIDAAEVAKIVGYAVGGSNPPSDEDTDNPPPEDNPPSTPPNDPPPPDDEDDVSPAPPVDVEGLLSPDELLSAILNKTSAFPLDIFVDKGDGGRYASGEPIRISFRSGQAGYLYLFDIDPEGNAQLLFPAAGQTNHIDGDVLYDFPGKRRKPTFVAENTGQHDVKGIVTTRPVRMTGFEQPARKQQQSGEARSGKQQSARSPQDSTKPRKMVVYPAAMQRFRGRLYDCLRKGEPTSQTAPKKLGPFAQDMCSYFVLPDGGKGK